MAYGLHFCFNLNLSIESRGNYMKKMNRLSAAYLITSIATVPVLSGCTTTDPYTGEQQVTKTTMGATFGALAGAIVGAAAASKNDRKKGVLIGAGIGAIAGGAAGGYMDQQEDKLREQLQGTGVSVTREGDNIILNMPSNITFDVDSSQLKPRFLKTLDSVVLVLKEYTSTLVTVSGHTDSTGSDQYNQKLSERRALSVAQYLGEKGVAKERLAAAGYGETRPIAPNNTPEGRAKNRRVELELEPITK
jgi:outer membrane protein OmpA-like peptidoglycan-associated protein